MTRPPDSVSLLPRANRGDLPSVVADEIRNWIAAGKLAPGDKLPTERELSEKYQVSRVVVREATSRLRHEGLAVAHQGKGVFVASLDDNRFLQITKQSLSRPEDYRKLYELRLMLETGAAALAAEHCDDNDLRVLQEALEVMRSIENLERKYVDADLSFHRAVSAATKNPFLSIMTSFVDSRLRESIALAARSLDFASMVKVTLAEHVAIFEGIRDRDPRRAEEAMHQHLGNASQRLGL